MDLNLEYEREEDGGGPAEVPQLPGVLAYGATAEEAMAPAQEALAEIEIAKQLWLETARERGTPIPEPIYRPEVARTSS